MVRMKQESVRYNLESLGHTVSERFDVPLDWTDSTPRTDGTKVWICDLEKGENEGEWQVDLLAQTCHEYAHVRFSDFAALAAFSDAHMTVPPSLFRAVWNSLEDARIERAMAVERPGTARWFRAKNIMALKSVVLPDDPRAALACAFAFKVVTGRFPQGYLDRRGRELITGLMPAIKAARLAKTTRECLFQYAQKCLEALLPYWNSLPEPRREEPEAGRGPRPFNEPPDRRSEKPTPSGVPASEDLPTMDPWLEDRDESALSEESPSSAGGGGGPEESSADKSPLFGDSSVKPEAKEEEELLQAVRDAEVYFAEPPAPKEKPPDPEPDPDPDWSRIEADVRAASPRNGKVRLDISDIEVTPLMEERYRRILDTIGSLPSRLAEEIREIIRQRDERPATRSRRGRFDSRLAWRVPVLSDPTVFRHRYGGFTPDTVVSVLVDCSGSMSGPPEYHAKVASAVIAEALARCGVPVAITGFTANRNGPVIHRRAVRFGGRREGIVALRAWSENRDGYSIRVAARELLFRPEEEKILLVLSDGAPMCPPDYLREPAIQDTALAVREARRSGVRVVGVYFGSGSHSLETERRIFGADIVFVPKIEALPRQLASVLRRVIRQGVVV